MMSLFMLLLRKIEARPDTMSQFYNAILPAHNDEHGRSIARLTHQAEESRRVHRGCAGERDERCQAPFSIACSRRSVA